MTIRRLSAPKAALGTARTVYVAVTPAATDVVPDQPEKVSATVARRLSERLTAIGYAVCPQLPCGDGVLQVVVEESSFNTTREMPHLPDFAMMEAAMNAVRGTGSATTVTTTTRVPVNVQLRVRLTFEQPDGSVGFRRTFTKLTSRQGTVGEVMKESIESVVKSLEDLLARQAPVSMVPLEVGGPLNRGVELLHKHDWAGAVTYFTELTGTQPDLDGAWYDLGFALEAENAWGPALEAYREAAKRAQKPHYESAVRTAQAVLFVAP
jgi:hypothetical protein